MTRPFSRVRRWAKTPLTAGQKLRLGAGCDPPGGEHAGPVGGDRARKRRCSNSKRRSQPEFARPGAPFVVAVDGADGHLFTHFGDTGTAADARAAAGVEHRRTGALERVEETVVAGELLDGLGAELDEELHAVGD